MSLHGKLRWFCLKLKWSLFRRTCFSLWFLGFVFHLGVIYLIFPWKTPKNISKMHALCDTGSLLCPLLWVISTLLTSCWPYLNLTNRQPYHFKPLVQFSNLGRGYIALVGSFYGTRSTQWSGGIFWKMLELWSIIFVHFLHATLTSIMFNLWGDSVAPITPLYI